MTPKLRASLLSSVPRKKPKYLLLICWILNTTHKKELKELELKDKRDLKEASRSYRSKRKKFGSKTKIKKGNMGKNAKKKESKKKKGKMKSEDNNDTSEEVQYQSVTEDDAVETSTHQLSVTTQSPKGKFKTSRQRKRAEKEQHMKEEKSSVGKKKTKSQPQQGSGKEKKEQTISEKTTSNKPDESAGCRPASFVTGCLVPENSNPCMYDMYDLRPSYFQAKDQKEPLDQDRYVARQPRNSSIPNPQGIEDLRPPFDPWGDREGDCIDGNRRNPEYQSPNNTSPSWYSKSKTFDVTAINNNLWSQDQDEEPSIDGNWRKVVRKTKKGTVSSSPCKSGLSALGALNKLLPSEIQSVLAKEIHKQLASKEGSQNVCDTFNLLRALAQACEAGKSENLSKILTAIQGSGFLRYQLPAMLKRVQQEAVVLMKESDKRQMISDMIDVYQTYLRRLPSAYADLPLDEVQRYFKKISVPNKAVLEHKLEALKKERDEVIQNKRRRNAKLFKGNAHIKPPNNFRELQIFPTIYELTSDETTFLRANVKKGRYQDTEHYLDVQFRLYREDFIAPLREGIQEIVQKIPKNERGQNIKTYDRVQIQEKKYTKNGIIYTLHFDVSRFRRTRWESSNRLVFGSFLCLSKDNFANTLFATVANRDPKDLAKGLLDVCFIEGQNVYGIEKRQMDQYVMAESPAYFEAYRHVLTALQSMHEECLPFQKYLVECSKDVDAPAYLRDKKEPVRYDLREALEVPHVQEAADVALLQPDQWPNVSHLPLNDSQYEALRTALTKEFSVIQGPPGTGKTYVGLKIARCLLTNSHAWNPTQDSPILMVCFTNHALDQFLEGILDFMPKGIIRVGSRCKSERLEKCNLKNDVNIRKEERLGTKKRIEKQLRRVETKKLALKRYEDDDGIKKLQILENANCISHNHLDGFYYSNLYDRECETLQDVFEAWICNKSNRRRKAVLKEVTPKFKDNYKEPSQQEAEMETTEYDATPYIFLADEDDWGVADSDVDIPGPDSFIDENSDEDSEDTWEDANSDLESEEEYFECSAAVNGDEVKERREGNKKAEEVLVISEKNRAPETINIDREFEISRQLHGEEDLFQPICASLDRSDNDVLQSGDETPCQDIRYQDIDDSFESSIKMQKEIEMNANQGWELDTQYEGTKKKKKKKSKSTASKATPSNIRRAKAKMARLKTMTEEEIAKMSSIWDLGHDDRLRLYLTWEDMLKEDFKLKIIQEEQAYDGLCREVESVRIVEEEKILKKAKVIGMTTTGAARYHSVLQRIKPRIVIIEEAAEVLEAHIITSLARDTEQVILIGDHKQLRPKPTVHELAIKYNLEISLFERMVLNKMDCKMLSIQHRMRPEIAQLTKRIYKDEIYDDVSVTMFEDVRGMKTNLFFLDHRGVESFHNGLQSYANDHEANMMVAMCKYLLQQDYKPSQITILTLYIGQLLTLKDKMPLEEFKGVRVTVVDNFQGEENDIILLSLVRSNTTGSIGFLKESNRICVALSRARKGLYCIGNFALLSKDRLWKEICEELKRKDALGDRIQLACANHGEITEVKKEEDFKKVISGGCGRPCDLRLACGHRCPDRCHGSDPEHKESKKCRKICRTLCPEELHRCLERCHYPKDCGPCLVPSTKIFSVCGHKGRTACWIDPRTKNCDYLDYKPLPCGHKQDIPCFLDPLQSLQEQYEEAITLLEKLSKICRSQRTVKEYSQLNDEDIMELNEYVIEMAYLKDRSLKIRQNWPKYESALQCKESCTAKCEKGLHTCTRKCHYGEECGPCMVRIKVEIPECGHQAQIPCFKDPDTIYCKAKCQRMLACGHECQQKCGDNCSFLACEMPCPRQCENNHPCKQCCHWGKPCPSCIIPTEKALSNCNHKIRIECHVDISNVDCFQPCERERSCGHSCDKWCYEPCDAFECKARRLKTLPCGHQKVLPCYVDLSTYTCTSLVTKPLPCGHELLMPCDLDPHNHICIEEVTRKLPCGHESKMKCHSDPSKKCCKERVTKKLSCGHELEMLCFQDPSKRQCSTQVMKKLPCGHEIMMDCHSDPLKRKCRAQVTRKLSCGHELEMKCHSDPSKQQCNKQALKKLTCGHLTQVPCNMDISKCTCKTLVPKALPCGHEIEIPCHEDVSQHTCKKEVKKKMQCGHEDLMPCNVDASNVKCTAKVDKPLPCGHNIKVPCIEEDLSKYKCTEKVSTKLKCGHEIQTPCSRKIPKIICREPVMKKMPCGHENSMPCNADPSTRTCTITEDINLPCGHTVSKPCYPSGKIQPTSICCEKVTRVLDCGHEHQMQCHIDPSQFICTKQVEKQLPCGHSQLLSCNMDTTGTVCKEKVIRRLACGHESQMSCNLSPDKYQCLILVKKELKCGHSKEVVCSTSMDAVVCNEITEKKLPCQHSRTMLCFKDVHSVCCEEIVTKELLCKHLKDVPCHRKITDIQCNEEILKTLPCKHEKHLPCYLDPRNANVPCDIVVTKILLCGHEVEVPCSKEITAISCDKPTKIILLCGHEVEVPCNKDMNTISCNKPVKKILSCGHEIEVPCSKNTSTISCDKPTKKQLRCGHKVEARCHVDVSTISCEELINKTLPCQHEVQTSCNKDVNEIRCDILTRKSLPCRHEVEVPCYVDINTIFCQTSLKKQLPCGHEAQVPCQADVTTITCKQPTMKTMPCSHEVIIPCNVDVTAINCDKQTMKTLPCGHEVKERCNVDVKAISCGEIVKKTLPCGHIREMSCSENVREISCTEPTVKQLPCDHKVEIPCNKNISTASCDALTKKELGCGHKAEIPCYKDVSEVACEELIKKQLSCGHEVEIPCNVDTTAISCYKLVMKQLPCSHGEVKLPCNLDISTISCRKSVFKELACGHMKELPCSTDITTVYCDIPVVKQLPCDHEIELPCHKTQEEYICQRPCERLLPCNHQCKQKCSEKCDPKLCTEATSKTVPCPNKHKITIPCNVEVEDTYVCNEEVTKQLSCGHLWQGECSNSTLPFDCKIEVTRTLSCPGEHRRELPCHVDVRKIPCGQKCSKILPCGHPCKLYCEEPCCPDKCTVRVLKTFGSCGHEKWLACGISMKAICLYRCLRPLNGCGHPCQAPCGKPCNKPCRYRVRKTLPCDHKLKLKCCDPVQYVRCPFPCTAKLLCGHICTGKCSTCQEKGEHSPCPFPCGRALVCSHRCHERCSDPCPPCFRECRGWCPHGKCQGNCSDVCKPCNMPCAYTCIHDKCNNLCHEMCDREPCNEPCQKVLACGHPCIGLCGESCPILCYVCTPAKVAAVSPNGQRNKDLRFIQLKECGHVIEVNRMDDWMQEHLETATNGQAQPLRCPICSVPIYFSFRYGNIVREALQRMFEVESFTFQKKSRRRQSQGWTKIPRTTRH
ncbi:uncharacterized protein LOC116300052 isoform X2 [Actinia tenebrosa]|uniref:Uncharacterized protein LOC116300052 isoform X2 n=1 Tax=Actinia tenebrosa TaxID=6105 RepID=A0A6P8I7Y5_ACTTE|nr:uncharacterized protein LOC116300052 isoform X2 [Actinia tenebrosa]